MAFYSTFENKKLLICSTNSSPSGVLRVPSLSIRGNSVFISLPLIYMPGKPSHIFLQLLPLIYLLQMKLQAHLHLLTSWAQQGWHFPAHSLSASINVAFFT